MFLYICLHFNTHLQYISLLYYSIRLISPSRLEWTVAQWGCYLDSEAQLQCWLEAVEGDICGPLIPQPGLREKASQLERLQTLLADLQEHQGSLSSLEERAAELFKKTGDAAFSQEARAELQGQFDDLIALVEVRKLFVVLAGSSS